MGLGLGQVVQMVGQGVIDLPALCSVPLGGGPLLLVLGRLDEPWLGKGVTVGVGLTEDAADFDGTAGLDGVVDCLFSFPTTRMNASL